jgi:hypothetical protein
MKTRGYKREKSFAQRDDDETVTTQRARVRGILALMRSTRSNKHMAFVNRDFDAAINIERCVALRKRPEELAQSIIVGQPFRLEV